MGMRGLRRGGVLAGAAAVLAGALAKASEAVARAADGEPLLLGRTNSATTTTVLDRDALADPGGAGPALLVTARAVGTGALRAVSADAPSSAAPAVEGAGGAGGRFPGTGVLGRGGAHTGQFGGQGVGVHGIGGGVQGGNFAGPGVMGTGGDGGAGQRGVGVSGSGNPGVFGQGSPGVGVWGRGGTGAGVVGQGNAVGVNGVAESSGGVGVQGHTNAGDGFGVVGTARAGSGVAGRGLRGLVGATPAEPGGEIGAGVVGQAAGGGTGVRGETSNGTGVDGHSATGTGVAGVGGHMGVYAAPAGGGTAVWLGTPDLAGDFHRGVLVRGDLTVLGDKAAAVPLPDGALGRLYAVEAPEAWFEDFGAGALAHGAAAVALAPDFAAVVRPEGYLVFLTPKGDCNGLYVSQQGPAGFEVRELRGGTGGVAFDYRVVARRKDRPGARLARVAPARRAAPARPPLPEVRVPEVTLPEVRLPDLPDLRPPSPPDGPARPAPPAPPARPSR